MTFLKLQVRVQTLSNLLVLALCYLVYLAIVSIIVFVQDSYKKINIISARQLNVKSSDLNIEGSNLKNSYIPIKLNQVVLCHLFLAQQSQHFYFILAIIFDKNFPTNRASLTSVLTFISFGLNVVL